MKIKDIETIDKEMRDVGYKDGNFGFLLGSDIEDGPFLTSAIGESYLWYKSDTGNIRLSLKDFDISFIPKIIEDDTSI